MDAVAGPQRKKTILVVDDTAPLRRALAFQLVMLGFAVREAEDGLQALEEVERATPDLVLSDLRMPRMDGLALLASLRESHPDLPVVVMSGAGLLQDAIGAMRLGAWDYVEKPLPPAEALRHALDRVLESAALREENRCQRRQLEATNRELRATLTLLAADEEAGRQLQFRMLPKNHMRFGPFEFSRELLPSAFLSGDFVDAFVIDDHRWAFYLADVAGHGVSSAMVTVLVRSLVQGIAGERGPGGDPLVLSPARVLERLNQEMAKERVDKHLTLFFGVIDNADATLVYANAGQFPWPIVYDGSRVTPLAHPGMPIGMLAHARYEEHSIHFADEGRLVAVSDGLLEVLPHSGVAAKQAFLDALFARDDVTVEQVRHELRLDERLPLPDDIAILLIKRGGTHASVENAGALRPR